MGCFWSAGNVLDFHLVHIDVLIYHFVFLIVWELYPN